jgi:probable rRNA maturation factor
MTITVAVDTARESPLWDESDDWEALIERAATAAIVQAGVAVPNAVELAVLLADDAAIRRVNAQWRAMDKPTNVLSFPSVTPDKLASTPCLGDLILAYETIASEAEADGKTLADHVTHLAVHGVLHLLGFDHASEDEARVMESLEIEILASLGVSDPYLAFDLVQPPQVEP